MSFFRQFPLTKYDIQKTGALTSITDLFRNVTARQVKLDPTIAYTDYRIINGERPDVVSERLYGDPDYYWTFFIVNDHLKIGHSAWPMSQGQLDTYLTQEYDGYSVIQMSDTDSHESIVNGSVCATTVSTDAGGDLDFDANPQNVVDLATSTYRSVMKYDSYMQQLWINRSGTDDDAFLETLKSEGKFYLSKYSASPFTTSTLTIGSNTYGQFCAVSDENGQKIASPGILPFVPLGRNAIHHYVFTPQVGDVIQFGYYSGETFYGIGPSSKSVQSGATVVELIEAKINSYGGIAVDSGNGNIQYYYFTDPQGFSMTAQDVNAVVSGNRGTFACNPTSRITPVTYAEYEAALNEQRSSIRVVNPTYIRAFVKQYRDLINA